MGEILFWKGHIFARVRVLSEWQMSWVLSCAAGFPSACPSSCSWFDSDLSTNTAYSEWWGQSLIFLLFQPSFCQCLKLVGQGDIWWPLVFLVPWVCAQCLYLLIATPDIRPGASFPKLKPMFPSSETHSVPFQGVSHVLLVPIALSSVTRVNDSKLITDFKIEQASGIVPRMLYTLLSSFILTINLG